MNKNNIEVGKILCKRRIKLGLSMRQLASIVGVSHTEISRIESGQRGNYNINILARICNVLGVDFIKIIKILSCLEESNIPDNQYEVIVNVIEQYKYETRAKNEYEALNIIVDSILKDESFILNDGQLIEFEIKNLN